MKMTPLRTFDYTPLVYKNLVCRLRSSWLGHDVSIDIFIYLTSPTRAGSPQQLMPNTVGPHYLTHPVNFPCGSKQEYPEKTHDLLILFTLFSRAL